MIKAVNFKHTTPITKIKTVLSVYYLEKFSSNNIIHNCRYPKSIKQMSAKNIYSYSITRLLHVCLIVFIFTTGLFFNFIFLFFSLILVKFCIHLRQYSSNCLDCLKNWNNNIFLIYCIRC